MIIVTAQIDFATPQDRDIAVKAATPIQQKTRDDEPGCIAYCFGADPCVPTRIQVYEAWADEAALVAHLDHPNFWTMRETLIGQNLTGATNTIYRTDAEDTVYGADGNPKKTFFV